MFVINGENYDIPEHLMDESEKLKTMGSQKLFLTVNMDFFKLILDADLEKIKKYNLLKEVMSKYDIVEISEFINILSMVGLNSYKDHVCDILIDRYSDITIKNWGFYK